MFERIADHEARALALLPEQFQKDDIRALLSSWMPEFQAIEDALWQLIDVNLDTATGARLAQWAGLVGEPRAGLADLLLRRVARARILANRSQGFDADLTAMLTVFATAFRVEDSPPASVLVTFEAFPGAGLAQRLWALVRSTLAGGVGAQTVVPVVADSSFAFAGGDEDMDASADGGFADLSGGLPDGGGALVGVVT